MEGRGYALCEVAPPTLEHAVSVLNMEVMRCARCLVANHDVPCVRAVPCGSVSCLAAAAGALLAEGQQQPHTIVFAEEIIKLRFGV